MVLLPSIKMICCICGKWYSRWKIRNTTLSLAYACSSAKIASSVDAALLGYNMYKCNQEFKGGDGIVMKDIETTIKGIGRLGKDGMRQTNEEIIRLMMS